MYSVWRQRRYPWPGLSCVGYRMALLYMAIMQLRLAWVFLHRLSYGNTLYGVNVGTSGLGLFALVVVWVYSVWRLRKYLLPGSLCVGYDLAVLCMAST